MQVRLAVRRALDGLPGTAGPSPLLLVGLSGGADSLALAAALAAEAPRLAVRAGALVIDHGLQPGSAATAERAAHTARSLGLEPVVVRRVEVGSGGGPESAARDARYAAFAEIAHETGASAILTAHTRDDQAEQVLLALARGSGTRSIAGIPARRSLGEGVTLVRPLVGADPEVGRVTTAAACRELGLSVWDDPHNSDRTYARVRVREVLLPVLVEELGPGVRAGLARSADLAREDAAALDAWATTVAAELTHAADARVEQQPGAAPLTIDATGIERLAGLPAAVRQRVIHGIAAARYGASLSREHTLAVARLVTHWRGQGPVFVPGIRVTRTRNGLTFARQLGSPRG
ncbi:tRNA lysidine(34) synthetase TilS [Leucobacter sp. G161]|uniref:tRNA lysidine(34) synthetase TilS n=1 Tax=Leucobacter sp. G161 TaxID=663704 RepID=UPI00073CFC8D|nr:tRNA lysidine(34) synthetase TilS [Leucobacter sp. G161]KUF06450.1 hypothetical protein AUL38_12945 [Leucobacter sp. G161]